MARSSTKTNKTIYQLKREELELSREKASELLEVMHIIGTPLMPQLRR